MSVAEAVVWSRPDVYPEERLGRGTFSARVRETWANNHELVVMHDRSGMSATVGIGAWSPRVADFRLPQLITEMRGPLVDAVDLINTAIDDARLLGYALSEFVGGPRDGDQELVQLDEAERTRPPAFVKVVVSLPVGSLFRDGPRPPTIHEYARTFYPHAETGLWGYRYVRAVV